MNQVMGAAAQETKQNRISEAMVRMKEVVYSLELLAERMEDPMPSDPKIERAERETPYHFSTFLSKLPEDICELAARVEAATARIQNSCF